jgi:hypothetical protein
MSDRVESGFGALRAGAHFEAPDPVAVRRRGDRLRRRTIALKTGGAALTLAVIATPLLSLSRHGADREPPVADDGLVAGNALALTDLPQRPELGAWTRTRAPAAALACVPARTVQSLGARDTLRRRYNARHGDSTSGPYAAEVREAVLAFPDRRSAKAALTTVTRRLRTDCAATDLSKPDPIELRTISGPGEGLWELYVRTADRVCTECDAVYFDREAALRVGDRLVLVSSSELGGPLQPQGLRASMIRLTTKAAVRAATRVDASGAPSSGRSG